MYHILMIEADPMDRKLMELFINSEEKYRLISSVSSVAAVPQRCAEHALDLILADMVTVMNTGSLDTLHDLKKRNSDIKLIMMTGFPEYSFLDRAKQIGADSFWYKEPSAEELLEILDRTMHGESVYPVAAPVVSLGGACSTDFTPRELEVLTEVVRGKTDADIAESLTLSVATVKFHVQKIREKTGFTTRTELAVLASESGLVINQRRI